MADDIRCPMCSKNNPAGSETCRFCGARLAPLGKSPAAGPSSNETPDWLRDIRSSTESGASSLPWQNGANSTPGEDSANVPDWLAEVRGSTQLTPADGSIPPADASAPGGKVTAGPADEVSIGMDDWLSSLRDPTEAVQPEAAPPAKAEGEDWAANLQAWNTPEGLSATPPPAQAQPSTGTVPAPADDDADLTAWL